MVRKRLMMVLTVACVTGQQLSADASLELQIKTAVAQKTTIESFAFNGFALPYVLEQVDPLLPDGSIGGLFTTIKDVSKAVVTSALAATWKRLHTLEATNESFATAFVDALYAELGHVGFLELVRQLGIDQLLSSNAQSNYTRFGAPYVKAVLAVVLKDLIKTGKSKVA